MTLDNSDTTPNFLASLFAPDQEDLWAPRAKFIIRDLKDPYICNHELVNFGRLPGPRELREWL
jgi:hypothetical protein